jgi:hypothetical protein
MGLVQKVVLITVIGYTIMFIILAVFTEEEQLHFTPEPDVVQVDDSTTCYFWNNYNELGFNKQIKICEGVN